MKDDRLIDVCSIIRIIFMVPIYAITSFLSIKFYKYAVYWMILQSAYQIVILISFYDLIKFALAPTLHDQTIYIQSLSPKIGCGLSVGSKNAPGIKIRARLESREAERSGLM